jgi:hypothetical protein
MATTAQPSRRTSEPAHQPSARPRSNQAQEALNWFASLYGFFASDAALARALGWDNDTVAQWRTQSVGRPRRKKREQVRRLLELCDEANVYLRDPYQAGEWVMAPMPQLGESPAVRLQAGGDRALRELFSHFFETVERPDRWVDDDAWEEDVPMPSQHKPATEPPAPRTTAKAGSAHS